MLTVQPDFAVAMPLMGFDRALSYRANGAGTSIAVIDFFGNKQVWGSEHGWAVLEILLTIAPGASVQVYDLDEIKRDINKDAVLQGSITPSSEAFKRVFKEADRYKFDILSASIGLGNDESLGCQAIAAPLVTIRQSISRMINEKNMAVVISAGNNGLPSLPEFPACITGVTSVGAVYGIDTPDAAWVLDTGEVICDDSPAKKGQRICWSSFGNLYAPGDLITGFQDYAGASFNGTSAATPFVSGAFAILIAEGYTAKEARKELVRTANRFEGVPVIDIARALGLPKPEVEVNHPANFADLDNSGFIEEIEAKATIRAWIHLVNLNGVIVTDELVTVVIIAWITETPV